MKQIGTDKKRLLSNFFSLSALRGANMILPLITLPYLVRVLGVENFGLVNFSLSIIMYFSILVSFGFELSATREISIHRDNSEKVSEIFSSVMLIKGILSLLSFIVLSIMIMFIDTLNEHAMLYYATFGIVVGNVLFPVWFFQGMERMKYITYINVISRIIFTILIFVLVKDSEDYIYVPILNSLGTIIGGIYALWLVFKLFSVHLLMPKREMVLFQLNNSYHFFLSRVATKGSRYYATTIIGLFFGNTVVGYYAMVEKLYYAFMSLGGIVSQTFYPYMSRTRNIIFYKKILFSTIGISITLLLPILYFNEMLLHFVFNIQNELLSKIFVIIFSGAIFGIASALIGYPILAAFGEIKYANNSLIYASIIYAIYITFSALIFKNIYLVAFALVLSALIGLGLRIYYINKVNIFKHVASDSC
jgi:O-antigen/teichoic acid export membrane protein